MPRTIPSLRLRLLAGTLAAIALIWLVSAGVAWQEAKHETEAVFDAHLAQAASLLLGFAEEDAEEIAEHLPEHRYARGVAFQFLDRSGRILARSPSAPNRPLSETREGFSDSRVGDVEWRVFSTFDPEHGVIVQVGESHSARESVADEVASHLLQPLAFALPVLGLALAILVSRGLHPLQLLAHQVAQRQAEDLAPLPIECQPRELRPLVERLNQLFGRVSTSLEQEKRFTADAAHELRTPLAAIRAHAQVAAAADADPATRAAAHDKVLAATDRAARLTAQLLTLARLDAQAWEASRAPCGLRAVAVDVLAELAPAALIRTVSVELEDGPEVSVNGHVELLRILLRNLVENAIRHSPQGGLVRVRCEALDRGRAAWHVTDQGPGIPAAQRAEVCNRFRRLDGAPEGGAGLGLSIAQRIAELHRARLEFADDPDDRGFRVSVEFLEAKLE